MSIYAIGDIQGCIKPLKYLLHRVKFDSSKDTLWLVGDLINRGPSSLETLRFLFEIKNSIVCVLGNHDLHLIACYYNNTLSSPEINEILNAPDCSKLINWLCQQKLVHYDKNYKAILVHAGIPPIWNLKETLKYAKEVESMIQNPKTAKIFFSQMYGNTPNTWKRNLKKIDRLRLITNYFTRMRFCTFDGQLEFDHKGDENSCSTPNFYPWFTYKNKIFDENKIIFGHWASLKKRFNITNIYPIDTGYVWGKQLTLLNIETSQLLTCKNNNL